MNNEERLIEVMAELLAEVHEMRTDTKSQLGSLNNKMDSLNGRVDKLEGEMAKMNLLLGENTRAIIKLADKIELIPDIIERIIKLETTVFKKAS